MKPMFELHFTFCFCHNSYPVRWKRKRDVARKCKEWNWLDGSHFICGHLKNCLNIAINSSTLEVFEYHWLNRIHYTLYTKHTSQWKLKIQYYCIIRIKASVWMSNGQWATDTNTIIILNVHRMILFHWKWRHPMIVINN